MGLTVGLGPLARYVQFLFVCVFVFFLNQGQFVTDSPAPRAALPVLFVLRSKFLVFRPAGATRCTDHHQGEIWQEVADPGL